MRSAIEPDSNKLSPTPALLSICTGSEPTDPANGLYHSESSSSATEDTSGSGIDSVPPSAIEDQNPMTEAVGAD